MSPVDLPGSKNMMGALECNIPLIVDARIFIIQVLKKRPTATSIGTYSLCHLQVTILDILDRAKI